MALTYYKFLNFLTELYNDYNVLQIFYYMSCCINYHQTLNIKIIAVNFIVVATEKKFHVKFLNDCEEKVI